MALTADGTLLVAVHDETHGGLVLHRVPLVGTPTTEVVDGGPGAIDGTDVGAYPSLAVGPDGLPRIAYYDVTRGQLRLATQGAGAWQVVTLDPDPALDVGRWASVAVSADGVAHVAYADVTTGRLRLSSTGPTPCAPIGTSGPVQPPSPPGRPVAREDFGRWTSVGISGDGSVVTSFYDAARGNLVLARCRDGAIATAILDGEDEAGNDTGDVGLFGSLAIDPDGNPAVAYFDRTHGALKLASSRLGELEVSVVDRGDRPDGAPHLVGQYASLAFGQDLPRVAYVDATGRSVTLARRTGHGAWLMETLASMEGPTIGGVGLGLDLAISADDQPNVAFVQWQQGPAGTELTLRILRPVAPEPR